MNRKKYHIEELMLDQEFVEWVKRPTKESEVYWSNLINNHPNQRETILQARNLVCSLKFKDKSIDSELFDKTLDHILSEKFSNTYTIVQGNSTYTRKLQIFNLLKIAATLLVMATLGLWIWSIQKNTMVSEGVAEMHWVTKDNPKGQKTTFLLPDSSKVILNSESSIRFRSDFEENRVLDLNGEAFFEVKKRESSKFIVKTANIQTVVLGTVFNVRAFDDEDIMSISLSSGQVRVEDLNRDEPLVLKPGEQITYDKITGNKAKSNYDKEFELAWKDGVLVFKKSTIADFVKTIERWYGVKVNIIGSTDQEWSISGRFNNEALKNVLESLKFARKIDYTLNENTVTLNFLKYE